MLMSARLLERQVPTDAMRSTVQRMLVSGDAMRRMIADLLDVTRVRGAGGLSMTRAHTDLRALAERVLREQRTIHPQRDLRERLDGDLAGHWDGDRLAQVLSNLIGNAITHGRAGEPVEVAIDGRTADRVQITVSNGGTIDGDLLPHVFEPFRTGSGPGRRHGLGLGLYIVRHIVAAHGGSVDVQSAGERTTFTVQLPRA
jgi:signal transduction histidine kinase